MNALKYRVKSALARAPRLESWARVGLHTARRWKTSIRIRRQGLEVPDPYHVYWIDTDRIAFHTNLNPQQNPHPEDRVFSTHDFRGRVLGGDWDLSDTHVEQTSFYQAIEARIRSGRDWSDTPFYREALRRIEREHITLWDCTNRGHLDRRMQCVDALVERIRENGYEATGEEVLVNIGRDGRYLFQDGRHRLAIARVLGVPQIPVQVLVRHERWQRFRENLMMMALRKGGGASSEGTLYQPPLHPDLADIPAKHECESRFNAICRALTADSGPLLDIGANLGYFCHRFEDHGFRCVAVESDPEITRAAQVLKAAENKTFEIVGGDVMDPAIWAPFKDMRFSVVLALNVFHHFLKTKTQFTRLVGWLKHLHTNELVFEPHLAGESQMQGAYASLDPAELVDLLKQLTGLRSSEPIFIADDGRTIYRLHRSASMATGST